MTLSALCSAGCDMPLSGRLLRVMAGAATNAEATGFLSAQPKVHVTADMQHLQHCFQALTSRCTAYWHWR